MTELHSGFFTQVVSMTQGKTCIPSLLRCQATTWVLHRQGTRYQV